VTVAAEIFRNFRRENELILASTRALLSIVVPQGSRTYANLPSPAVRSGIRPEAVGKYRILCVNADIVLYSRLSGGQIPGDTLSAGHRDGAGRAADWAAGRAAGCAADCAADSHA
jgi:hypothetical protein